ncbi:tail fiber protein [Hymenobacter saemangeumensis]|uniref:Tail fiber protein n=1 Tax=Hymenobacter saemangeumensis TaxID=1084522 RepID=A0ABP8IMI6_9BACT
MDEFIGIIKIFAGNFAPRGWAICDGSLLPISQNTALFSLLGTMYGGNGTTTFALPDLRGRVPVGVGQGPGLSPYTQGQLSGSENVTLTTGQMPAHNHLLNGSSTPGTTDALAGNFLALPNGTTNNTEEAVTVHAYGPSANVTANPAAIGAAGGNQPVPVLQPLLAINYIICLEGIYPSRN